MADRWHLSLGSNHHFIVVYRRAKRDPGHPEEFWFGHITHIATDEVGLDTKERRIAFRDLDELPAIIRQCIGLAGTKAGEEAGDGSAERAGL